MILAVVEDSSWSNFKPLTYTRPSYALFDAKGQLLERVVKSFEHDSLYLYTRDYLAGLERERRRARVNEELPSDERVLVINGLVRDLETLSKVLERAAKQEFVIMGGEERLYVALLKAQRLEGLSSNEQLLERVKSLFGEVNSYKVEKEVLYSYPWELLEGWVSEPKAGGVNEIERGVLIKGPRERLKLAENIELNPMTVIDVRLGEVVFEEGVVVEPSSVIVGPCRIGRGSLVTGGKVGPFVTVGPVCRLAGEIEHSVILGYSNKRHYGFIGHSLIGEWVNLGAGTTNSNLKNTYGEVRVKIDGNVVGTGRQFFGTIIGDHVRTAIGTLVETGKTMSCFSMALGRVATDLPPFTAIGRSGRLYELELAKEVEVAKRMMARRGVAPSEEYLKVIEHIYNASVDERQQAGAVKAKLE